jgi:hypothetical protein
MKRRIGSTLLVSIMLLAGVGRLSAQAEDDGGGLGAILDWLHKLSGPRFVGAGVTGFFTVSDATGIRLRLDGVYRTSISEAGEVEPENANITMITVQPTVEFPIPNIPFDLGVGVGLHRFGGDVDGFWHYSIPILAQFRPRGGGRVVPRIGVAVHVFPTFDATDFAPLIVDVSRENAEAVLQLFVGLDFHFHP